MRNLETNAEQSTEVVRIIRKGDLVTYNGELWIIKELGENTVDLVDPNNLSNIAPGVKRNDVIKGSEPISGPFEESTPGRLLEKVSLSVGEILEPGYKFSKQGQTFEEAMGDFDGIYPERLKMLVENGITNGYGNIIFSDPKNQN